ncbi:hypothetical protein DYB36_010849, partial [Aphanomyces astaci]
RVVTLLVVAHTPHAILLPHVLDIVPLVVDALNLKEPPYAALLGHPALVTFEMCFQHDPQLVYGYLNQLFPGLLWQSQHWCVFGRLSTNIHVGNVCLYNSHAVKDRLRALGCLASLAKIKYELIHPHKERVIKGLLAALDDRKRTVRQAAVKVRNQWSIL